MNGEQTNSNGSQKWLADVARLQRVFGGLAVVGLAVSVVGMLVDRPHFWFSYLTAYAACLTIVWGMMFFVMLHYIADAGWSTVVRRPAEQFLAALPALAVLFVPVLIGMGALYGWVGSTSALAQAKAPFLNVPFFILRVGLYFACWLLIGRIFRGGSLRQDETGDPGITLRLRRLSAPGLIVYALTLSLAAIDWLMSLDYHWFSTIFGVYVWSGATVSSLALLGAVVVWLRRGPLHNQVTNKCVHDLGKWVFAFSVFWAYIAFSQYFLMWYANIPEETAWMIRRWTGESGASTWWVVSTLMPIALFIVPFALLMSAHTKRRAAVFVPVCGIVLLGHYFDCYWLVMPTRYTEGPAWGLFWIDLGTLALIAGASGWFVLRAMGQASLYPVKDPRLAEALVDDHQHDHDDGEDSAATQRNGHEETLELTHGR